MNVYDVVPVAEVDCGLVDAGWAFETERAEAIERIWIARTTATPEIFNGRVLLLHHGATGERAGRTVFRGACLETSFKAFLAWRDLGFPPAGVRNCFSMAALESRDGAFILGEMNVHTAQAGQVYFPSGTPDRSDIIDGKVDFVASARRELQEETGLESETLRFENGFTLVMNETRLCCMKRVAALEDADTLVARIHGWLAQDPKPELARMHVVRTVADITLAMPDFVATYIRGRLA